MTGLSKAAWCALSVLLLAEQCLSQGKSIPGLGSAFRGISYDAVILIQPAAFDRDLTPFLLSMRRSLQDVKSTVSTFPPERRVAVVVVSGLMSRDLALEMWGDATPTVDIDVLNVRENSAAVRIVNDIVGTEGYAAVFDPATNSWIPRTKLEFNLSTSWETFASTPDAVKKQAEHAMRLVELLRQKITQKPIGTLDVLKAMRELREVYRRQDEMLSRLAAEIYAEELDKDRQHQLTAFVEELFDDAKTPSSRAEIAFQRFYMFPRNAATEERMVWLNRAAEDATPAIKDRLDWERETMN